jgi:2-keto-4-pentenoate hydratase/2-oxohepta-3-ene-1,7-dioic acid hydratase in catechol pathway
MRFVRFFDSDGTTHLGVRQGNQVRDLGHRSMFEPISDVILQAAPSLQFASLKLDAPIRQVPKLFALAGNYRKHIAESGFTNEGTVWTPQIFWKPNTAILEPGGIVTLRPKNHFFDWEVELAVIIGTRVRDLKAEDAMSTVFGYTVLNDLSERKFNSDIVNRDKREFDPFFDWLVGKWFDGSAPLGPEIVTADEIADPHNLALSLSLNGEVMQNSSTSYMIFRIPETIAALSAVLTLEPGDVIAMGTPEGVGFARGRALKDGDHLRAEIEGIGSLDTYIREEIQ